MLYVQAEPVFVDLESLDVPHMSLEKARRSITLRTKAIIIMHYGGYLMDMPAWRELADAHGLILIEDAAHAPGLKGVGSYSHAAAFSFYSNKNMTSGEGGMLLVHDPATEKRLRLLRSHGMTTTTLERDQGHAFEYDVVELGFNYRMDELRAAVGLVQLEALSRRNRRRKELSARYRAVFSQEDRIFIPFSDEWQHCGHIMPVLLPEGAYRPDVMASLRERGVQSSVHYRPIHTLTQYRRRSSVLVCLPLTEDFGNRVLTIPLHPDMVDEDVDYVAANLISILNAHLV
ncbi:MAG: DegT/DnrJ/EryC1/StrS aminotransferase family protein [Proteobacteria bacterium]|nr:DegT/DnrJ/EryC1/StrS aminotransferase family protein [Pseudomonadota bacterium]